LLSQFDEHDFSDSVFQQGTIDEHLKRYDPDVTKDLIDAYIHEIEARKHLGSSNFTRKSSPLYCSSHHVYHLPLVITVLCYRLPGQGMGVQLQGETDIFLLGQGVHSGSEVHTACTRGSVP
jgi:hypothetical protein